MNLVNARYGSEPGLKAYTHVSDRFGPFATQTIPATVNEAPYILDGLLMTRAGRRSTTGHGRISRLRRPIVCPCFGRAPYRPVDMPMPEGLMADSWDRLGQWLHLGEEPQPAADAEVAPGVDSSLPQTHGTSGFGGKVMRRVPGQRVDVPHTSHAGQNSGGQHRARRDCPIPVATGVGRHVSGAGLPEVEAGVR